MKACSQRVLMVFAHSMDETVLAGGLTASLVSSGYEVRVICLAPGDDERTVRFRKACEVLGNTDVETLRYESGSEWPEEENPRVSGILDTQLAPMLATTPLADLAGRIAGRIAEFGPDVVITHSQHGDTGHADHAAVHRATVHAFEAAGGSQARLFALAWPVWRIRLNGWLMKIGGRDIRQMGSDGRFNLFLAITAQRASTDPVVSIDISSYLDVRRLALRHYGQGVSHGVLRPSILERLPLWLRCRIGLGTARLSCISAPEEFSINSSGGLL